jgi:hypothetical protein
VCTLRVSACILCVFIGVFLMVLMCTYCVFVCSFHVLLCVLLMLLCVLPVFMYVLSCFSVFLCTSHTSVHSMELELPCRDLGV